MTLRVLFATLGPAIADRTPVSLVIRRLIGGGVTLELQHALDLP